MLEAIIVENWKQNARIGIIQSLDVCITIIGVETINVPNMDFVKRGVLLGFTTKLGSGLGGTSTWRNLN